MNINRVEIGGGLVREPKLEYLPSGYALCEMTVAVNGARYDAATREQVVTTDFIAVQIWGWLGEQIMEMGLSTGDEVLVYGQIAQREITKKDGTKEKKTRVVAARVQPTKMRNAGTPASGGPDPWTGQ